MNGRETNKLRVWREYAPARGKDEISRGRMAVRPILASTTGWTRNNGAPHLKLEKDNEESGYSSVGRYEGGNKLREFMLNCLRSRIIYWDYFLILLLSLYWSPTHEQGGLCVVFLALPWRAGMTFMLLGLKTSFWDAWWLLPRRLFLEVVF